MGDLGRDDAIATWLRGSVILSSCTARGQEVVGDVELVHHFEDWNENFKRRDGEKAWRRLAQVMDMTEEELNRDIEEEIKKICG